MERIQRIFEHPVYRRNFNGIQEAEKDRRFCRHDLQHFLDVARIIRIYDLEDGGGLPEEIVYAAALLHDIGRYEELTCGTPHDAAGAELAEEILTDCGFAAGDIGMIKDAIVGHRNKDMCGGKLAAYLYRADKQSRCCFACSAADECKWSDEKKNHVISI